LDSTRDYSDDGTNTGNGTAQYTNLYGNTWNFNLTTSDSTANFSTDLSDPPASGTTFLAQVSDPGLGLGFTITTNDVAEGQNNGQASSLWFSSYSGTSGSRYFYNNTATVNVSGSGNSDTVTWNVNQQSSNNYSGSQFGNMSYSGSSPSGSATATVSSSGQSSSNISMTDAYQRSSGGSGSGTYQSSGNSTQSYSSRATEQQVYSSGSLNTDTLTYRNGSSGSGSQSASNNDSYTSTALKGTTKGSDFFTNSGSAQSQSNSSGTLNLLTNTSSGVSTSSSNASGWGLSFSTANYNASDGSSNSSMSSLLFTMGSVFNFSTTSGGFNAYGVQTSGTSFNTSGDNGLVIGSTSSEYAATGNPTSTYKQFVLGTYSDNGTGNLSANADGSANGYIQSNSNTSQFTDTTTTLVGTLKMADGTAEYDNKNHSSDSYSTASNINMWLWSGQAYGNATQHVHDNVNWDYKFSVKVDLNNDMLHGTLKGKGSGVTGFDDTVALAFGNGTTTGGQTFAYWQKGNTSSSVDARGNVPPNNVPGTTSGGNWTFKAKASGNTNDQVTIWMTLAPAGWQETGRQFSIYETSTAGSKYVQDDWWKENTLGITGSSKHHETINTFSYTLTSQQGTSTNYTFNNGKNSWQSRHGTSNSSWDNQNTGESSQSSRDSFSSQASASVRAGTDVNHQR